MNNPNPYSPTDSEPVDFADIRKVRVQPMELLQRAKGLMGDQYWLFVGISLAGIFIGSAVPMGIIMGAMMVGIYICFLKREQGQRVEFATLFKGFDQFADSLVAMLIMVGVSLVVMFPLMIAMFALMIVPMIASQGNGGPPATFGILTMLLMYPLVFIASFLVYIPFLFTFQLIADRKLTAVEAVKLSARGAWKNLGGVILFLFVVMVISTVLAIMCYIPVFFFLPVSFGAMFVLYRDVFPHQVSEQQSQ